MGVRLYATIMKALLKKIPFAILARCCKSNKIENEIHGNWSCCSYRGDYFELYIQNDKYMYVTNFDLIFPWEELYIKGDSLFQFKEAINGTRSIMKSRIEYKFLHTSF